MSEIPEGALWQVELVLEKSVASSAEEFFLQSGALGSHELLYQESVTQNLVSDSTRLFFFFSEDFPVQAFVPMALGTLGITAEHTKISQVEYKDYVREFEATFKSFELTPNTWLTPPWDIDNSAIPDSALRLVLKPGLAFGTGLHETTKMICSWIETLDISDRSLCDLGCGSGILSICASLAGADKVFGYDVDQLSVQNSVENLSLNQEFHSRELRVSFDQGSFKEALSNTENTQIFVSNILAKVFLQNADLLLQLLESHKDWALSGINAEQSEDFAAFLKESGQTNFQVTKLGDWVMFSQGTA